MKDMRGVCPGFDALAAWIEGTLSPEDRAATKAHLASCDECRRAVAIAASVGTPPGREMDEKLVERLASVARRRPAWRWTAAAGVLAAAVISFWLIRSQPSIETAQEPIARPSSPVAVPKKPAGENPAVVVTPTSEPAPQPRNEEPPRKEPSETPVVKEAPKPGPGVEEPRRPDVASGPHSTETDPSALFGGVLAMDFSGEVWVRHGETDPSRAKSWEKATFKDTFSTRAAAGAFTVGGAASVVLEKETEVTIAYFKPDKAYDIRVARGQVLIDTERNLQDWRISGLAFLRTSGRLSLEPRPNAFAVQVLEGRADLRVGTTPAKVEAGREIILASDGTFTVGKADPKAGLVRLSQTGPKTLTTFAARFEEKADSDPFPYSLLAGKFVTEPKGTYLQAETVAGPKPVWRAALKPEVPIVSSGGMALRFRYRATCREFSARLGKYACKVGVKDRGDRWVDAEVPLSEFLDEGVPMVPLTDIPDVTFEAVFEKKTDRLDVDAVSFLRRVR